MSVVVVAIVATNTAVTSLGWGPLQPQRVKVLDINAGSQIHRGKVTLVGPGYIAGPPDRGAELPTIFSRARAEGVRYVAFGGRYFGSLIFGAGNITFVYHESGLAAGGNIGALGPGEMLMYQTEEPEPGCCSRSEVEGHLLQSPGRRRRPPSLERVSALLSPVGSRYADASPGP